MGIHRPYYSKQYFAALSAKEAEKKYKTLEKLTREYLKSMGAPDTFISEIFLIPSDEIKLVPRPEFIRMFPSKIPYLDQWLSDRCGKLSRSETRDLGVIQADRIIFSNGKLIPKGMSSGYVNYLINKSKKVRSCEQKTIIKHQKKILTGSKNQ